MYNTMETIVQQTPKKATAFRLNADLLERLKMLAKKDNRSLNNFVENVLMSVAYNEPNETTKAAIKDAKEKMKYCSVCGNLTDTDPCGMCQDPRRRDDVVCVVECRT